MIREAPITVREALRHDYAAMANVADLESVVNR